MAGREAPCAGVRHLQTRRAVVGLDRVERQLCRERADALHCPAPPPGPIVEKRVRGEGEAALRMDRRDRLGGAQPGRHGRVEEETDDVALARGHLLPDDQLEWVASLAD